jgi:hypothetical protein
LRRASGGGARRKGGERERQERRRGSREVKKIGMEMEPRREDRKLSEGGGYGSGRSGL